MYVGGTVAFLLLLGFADSGELLAIALAFAVFAAAGAWLFEPAVVRFRRLDPQLRPRVLVHSVGELTSEYRRSFPDGEYHSDDRFGIAVEAILFLLAGILLSLVGLSILLEALPGWRVAGILFGVIFIVTAWLLLHRYRRRRIVWRERSPEGRLSEGGHAAEVLLYLVAAPTLAVFGFILLARAL